MQNQKISEISDIFVAIENTLKHAEPGLTISADIWEQLTDVALHLRNLFDFDSYFVNTAEFYDFIYILMSLELILNVCVCPVFCLKQKGSRRMLVSISPIRLNVSYCMHNCIKRRKT